MLYATNRFPGDGMTTQYEISFTGGYLDRAHVKAYVEGADLVHTPVTLSPGNFLGQYTIGGLAPVPDGSTLVIYRDTPKAPIVDFVNGSRLTEANLDTATRQGSFIAAEGADAVSPTGLAGFINQLEGFSSAAGAAGVARDQALLYADLAVLSADQASTNAALAGDSANYAGGVAAQALNSSLLADTYAANASLSANNAAISKTGADLARDYAVIAKNSAESALDSLDDRYLGAKAVAPTTDNDGGALLIGALYWDTALPGMRSWNGGAWVTLPAATAAAISNTPSGSVAATTVQGAINELAEIKVDLAAATGASIVGYNAQFLNAVTRTLQSKAQEFPSVFDYMTGNEITAVLSEASSADLTTPFQRALTAMAGLSAGRQRYLEVPRGLYSLTQIKMEDLQDVTVIMKGAKLNAISAAALTSMVEIVNTLNFRVLGSWETLGGNRTNYEAMVHCTARPGGVIEPTKGICTTTEIHGLVGRNAKCVLQLGDYTKDDVISEINIYGLGAKDCPTVVHAGGSQTGATFHGCNLTSEANAVINAVPGTTPEVSMWLEGGFYTVNGGEVLHLLSSANETIRMSPCQSAFYSSPYPMLRMNGVHFECAATIAAISNPRGIAAPSSDISQLALIGCGGYMNPSIRSSNLIDVADSTYEGRIQTRGNNFYSQFVPRVAQNIGVVASAPTLIDTDSTSFGAGHKHWLGGISGGKVLHDPIAAISASNLNSQSVASGASGMLKWITKASSGVFGRYAAAYNTATGVFTVPAFGVTSMRISMAAAISSPGAGYVEVLRNGSRAAIRKIVATDLSVDIEYSENDIPAGTTYSIKLSSTGGTTIAFGASATDFLTVTIGTN